MNDTPCIADRYQLRAPLGRGAMGEVWEGFDRRLERRVAVKLIRRALLDDDGQYDKFVDRFLREAKMAAKLEHPGVPTVHDVGMHEGEAFLTMQLVRGNDMGDLLAEHERLPIAWVAAVGAQVASVLAWAHQASMVHRDLKPRNLMLCADGTVKVLDFGIAVMLETVGMGRLTTTGQILGTPSYMSPEQATGGTVGPATDLYALGCVLYELLSGAPPFCSGQPLEVVSRHVHAQPSALRPLRADIPASLEHLVMHLLEKDPGRRPATAAEVYQRLVPLVAADAAVHSAGPRDLGPTRPFHFPLGPLPGRDGAARAPTVVAEPGPDDVVADLDVCREQAVTLVDAGRITQAGQVLSGAVHDASSRLGSDHPDVVDARVALANVYQHAEDFVPALAEFRALVPDLVGHYGPDHDLVADVKRSVAECYLAIGDPANARLVLQELFADRRRIDPRDPELAELHAMLERVSGSPR